jgi:ferredoxin
MEMLDIAPETRLALEAHDASEGARTVFLYDEERCIRCGLCAVRCPTAAITMQSFHFDEVPSDGGAPHG